MLFEIRKKNILEDLFSSVLSKSKNNHPSGNLKFNNLDIFQSLKLRILMGRILRISLKLNFTPDTLCSYGLKTIEIRTTPVLFSRPKHVST